jgi:hypothetical protein
MGLSDKFYEFKTKFLDTVDFDEEEYDVIPEDADILDTPPTPDVGDADSAVTNGS